MKKKFLSLFLKYEISPLRSVYLSFSLVSETLHTIFARKLMSSSGGSGRVRVGLCHAGTGTLLLATHPSRLSDAGWN